MADAPAGSIDEQATALAGAVALGGQAALSPLLAAYAAAGIPVIGEDGHPLPGFEADQVGPGWWQVWLSAGGNPLFTISLADAMRLIVAMPNAPALDTDAVAAAVLVDLRTMALDPDPHRHFFARFITAISSAGSGIDALAVTTTPADVRLTPIAIEFLMAGLLRSLTIAVVATDPAAARGPGPKIASVGLPLPLGREDFAADAPAGNPCNPSGDAEAASFWTQWIASKILGGINVPGMEDAMKSAVNLIVKNASLAKSIGTAAAIASGAISALTFMLQMATLKASFDISPNPLVRTHADHPHGGEATISSTLTYDLEGSSLDGGAGIKNCLLVFLNALGIQAALPTNGGVPGAKLTFKGIDGFGHGLDTTDAFVQFPNQEEISKDTSADPGTEGRRTITVQGIQQKKTVPDNAPEWSREATVQIVAQPEAENGRSLANMFWDSFVAGKAGPVGVVAPVIDVLKSVEYDLGEYSFLVTDWRLGLTTEGSFGGLDYLGEKCDGLDGEWLIKSTVNTISTKSSLLFTIEIDAQTQQGTYTYDEVTTDLVGVTHSTASGNAYIAPQPDGDVIMTLDKTDMTVTTTFAPGVSQSVKVKVHGWLLAWQPGGNCKPA